MGIDLRDGLNLYMDEIGHKAGGRDIKVIVEDIGSNQVSRALDTARKLVERSTLTFLPAWWGQGRHMRCTVCGKAQDSICDLQCRC